MNNIKFKKYGLLKIDKELILNVFEDTLQHIHILLSTLYWLNIIHDIGSNNRNFYSFKKPCIASLKTLGFVKNIVNIFNVFSTILFQIKLKRKIKAFFVIFFDSI